MGQGMEDAKAMLRYLMNKRQIEQAQEQKAFIEGGGRLGDGSETPIPGAASMKRRVDETLTKSVVEPMAARGYGDLGAAIATVPSVVADVVLPDTVGELAMPPPVRGGGKVIDLAAKRAEKAGGKEAAAMDKAADKLSHNDKVQLQGLTGEKQRAAQEYFRRVEEHGEGSEEASQALQFLKDLGAIPPKRAVTEATAMARRTKLTPEEMAAQRKADNEGVLFKMRGGSEAKSRNADPKDLEPVRMEPYAGSKAKYKEASQVMEDARKIADFGKGSPRSPFSDDVKPMPGKEAEFEALKRRYEELDREGDSLFEAETSRREAGVPDPEPTPHKSEEISDKDMVEIEARWRKEDDAKHAAQKAADAADPMAQREGESMDEWWERYHHPEPMTLEEWRKRKK